MSDRFIKLVRDKVGDDRDEVIYKRAPLNDEDFRWALREKLIEEAEEFEKYGDWNELIDVYEVIWAIVHEMDKSMTELARDAERERARRGSFINRMSLWIRRPS